MRIKLYPKEGVSVIHLIEDHSDYGREITEGVYGHFRRDESGEEILTRIEVYDFVERGIDALNVEIETFGVRE